MNYIYLFANNSLKELDDCFDLRDVSAYKSFIKKEDDTIPAMFKLVVDNEDLHFCARNLNEKWVWIVIFERVMDFRANGKSPYNSEEMITSRGFMGQE